MDDQTVEAYDRSPADYAADWDSQPSPEDLHELVMRYFRPGPTADVGCGSGRDTAWLRAQGFDAVGFDVSAGLLAEARRRHPEIAFYEATLPQLTGVDDRSFMNVLCETVIMHLPSGDIPASVHRLSEILVAGGCLYLSWRVTDGTDRRMQDGRLYSSFAASLVVDALAGMTLLHDSESVSASSGRTVHRLVAKKVSEDLGGAPR
jgi:SAM-dependent methyltransferase